jgi:putative ABC transport system permease protein
VTTGPTFRFAWCGLRAQYGQLALTIVALATGVALVCAMDIANRAVRDAFTDVLDTMAGRVSLEIAASDGGFFAEDEAARLAHVPGVELAVPIVTATAFVADDSGELLNVLGVDVANESAVRAYATTHDDAGLVDDPLVFLSQPDSIAVPRRFADRRGLALGSTLALETPSGRRTFTVRGLLEAEGVGLVYGGSLVVMDVWAAQAAFTKPGLITRVDVVVPADHDRDAVRAAIAAILPAGLRVDSPTQRKADFQRAIRSMHVLLDAIAATSLFAGLLVIVGRLSTVFERREWQLGAMRALGVTRAGVWAVLMAETAILAAIGVAIGLPAGVALGRVLLPIVAATTAVNYRLVAPAAVWSVRPVSLALATALGFLCAFVAAAFPARRAARRAAIETIRSRGTEMGARATRTFWVVRGTVVGMVVAAVLLQRALGNPAYGMAASALLVVATGLAATPLVWLASRWVLPLLGDAAGPVVHFAASTVASATRRTSFMAAALGIGLGSALWLTTVARSFERSLVDALSHVITADLIVGSANVVGGREPVPIDEGIVPELARVSGVDTVVSWRVRDWEYAGGPIAIDSFDPEYFRRSDLGQWTLVGGHDPDPWEEVARGSGAVVSSSFATNVGVGVGDVLSLETPTGPLAARVAGITVAFTSPRGTLFLSRDVYRRAWNDSQITQALVKLTPGTSRDVARAAIERTLGHAYRLEILSASDLLHFWIEQVRRGFAATPVLAGLVLLVVLIGLTDALVASVAERTREIGALRALGLGRRHVTQMVVFEALLTGTVGIVLAVGLGLALGLLWVDGTFPLLLGWALGFHFPGVQLAVVVILTMVLCAAAGALPAVRAGRLAPAEALRYE